MENKGTVSNVINVQLKTTRLAALPMQSHKLTKKHLSSFFPPSSSPGSASFYGSPIKETCHFTPRTRHGE